MIYDKIKLPNYIKKCLKYNIKIKKVNAYIYIGT